MGFRAGGFVARIALTLFLGLAIRAPSSAAQSNAINILYLTDFDISSSEASSVTAGIKDALTVSGRRAEVFPEFLDLLRLPSERGYIDSFPKLLHDRYKGIRFDIIIAQSSTSINLASRFREAYAPGMPIYCFDLIGAGLPAVAAGDSSLIRLWTNLFQNALQAMRGSGELEVDARREGRTMFMVRLPVAERENG
jgi:signal transduction histidine kinase